MAGFWNLTQEQEEQLALDQFRAASGLLPGKDERVVPDPPDFVVVDGDRRTAVEVTRFHKSAGAAGSADAKQEGNEQLLVSIAQRIFESEHLDLHVEVVPHFVGVINRRGLRTLARALADAVAAFTPELLSEGPVSRVEVYGHDLPDKRLGDVMVRLSIARWTTDRWRPTRSSVWNLGAVGYPSPDVDDLRSRVTDKERDLPRYQGVYDECWLLVYSVPLASTWIDFEVLTDDMFSSGFDGVGVVDVFTGQHRVIPRRKT